jgi:hypothetical protein
MTPASWQPRRIDYFQASLDRITGPHFRSTTIFTPTATPVFRAPAVTKWVSSHQRLYRTLRQPSLQPAFINKQLHFATKNSKRKQLHVSKNTVRACVRICLLANLLFKITFLVRKQNKDPFFHMFAVKVRALVTACYQ